MYPFPSPMMMGQAAANLPPILVTTLTNPTQNSPYTVPAGAQYLHVVGWAGAGGGLPFVGWGTPVARGGGAGFVEAVLPVTAGEVLSARVGMGGTTGPADATTPNSASSNNGGGIPTDGAAAAGGGYTGLFRGSTPLIIAGGGGAGGGPFTQPAKQGGPGGGETAATVTNVGLTTAGGDAGNRTATGGSQTAGGAGTGGTNIVAGSSLQGAANSWMGGGGGYYGGAAAYTQFGTGGSSFIRSSGILKARTIAGSDFNPGNMSHADYVVGVGVGGDKGAGGNGRLIIRAYAAVPALPY